MNVQCAVTKQTLMCVLLMFCHIMLYDPTDCSLTVSSVRGIFQARILEWVAISSSRGYS